MVLLPPLLGLLLPACSPGEAISDGEPLLDGGQVAPSPPLAQPERVRFVVMGDTGAGNGPQARNAQAMRDFCAAKADEHGPGCDFMVLPGDLFYYQGVTGPDDPQVGPKYAEPYGDLGFPVYAALGNHEYADPPFDRERARGMLALAAARDELVLPGPWYRFDAGPARFLVLDTHAVLMGWSDAEQQAWLEAQLAEPWGGPTVVVAHHPFLSNGKHGIAGEYEGSSALPYASGKRVRALYDTLCGRVDLMVGGHDHNRQWLEPHCGIELVVSGAGSKTAPLKGRGAPTLFEEDRERGFAWFELTADQLTGLMVDERGRVDFERTVTLSDRAGR
ncbi:MAG: metallophosphoesterase [Alphaproteobacteria bacterium]|nr:metallophosphoesterase [Alphaproteobacteria bacterium]